MSGQSTALPEHKVVNNMKKISRFTAVLSAAILFSSAAFPAMAAGPLEDNADNKYDEATEARLKDNLLEYDEIPLLVHEYNVTLLQTRDDLEKTRQDLLNNAEELQGYRRKMKTLKDDAKDEGNAQDLVNYATQEMILEQTAYGIESAGKNLVSRATARSLQQGEDTITQAAQSLMISYDTLRRQRDTLSKLQELYEKQYQLTVNKRNLGLATDTEVFKAQTNQLSALGNIQSIDGGLMKMKPSLCTLTGWPGDGEPEIGEVPTVDLSLIAGMNLEEDTRKAIGNNQTLIAQRNSEEGKTYDGTTARLAYIEEGDQKMTIEMKRLYDDVSAKKAAYESAMAGYQSEEKSASGSDRMYQLGMMSEADYLGSRITYYQKKAAYESSDMALRLAIETYGWAVKGFAELD